MKNAWGEITFLRCSACGSWSQSPAATTTSLARWFDSDEYQGSERGPGAAYANYAVDEENRVAEARLRYKDDLAPILPKGARVLEIGCATGSLLSVLREDGHSVTGLDLSPRFAQAASALHGINVHLGDLLDVNFPDGAFDAVLVMGTIGNLRSLPLKLKRIRQLLTKSGVLLFNFPDANSLWVRMVYRHRFWMFTPSVSVFMTARGCARALAASGFGRFSIRQDYQRPSFRKLLHHGKADFLFPILDSLGLGRAPVPFLIPVPTVRIVTARPPEQP